MPWNVVVNNSEDMAVHAVLIPGGEHGKILFFGGFFVDDTHLFDVDSYQLLPAEQIPANESPKENIFCAGHAFLADGRILTAGGQLPTPAGEHEHEPGDPDYHEGGHPGEEDVHEHGGMSGGGERACWVFEPNNVRWVQRASLNLDPLNQDDSGGRWYPTLTTLGNGEILAVGGHPDVREFYAPGGTQRHSNNIPERYNPNTNEWILLATHPPAENQKTAFNTQAWYDYQRTHLMPDGSVFFASPVRGKNRFYNPYAGVFIGGNEINLPPDDLYATGRGDRGEFAKFTSVMLPLLHSEVFKPRVLLMGSEFARRIDLDENNPSWKQAGKRDWGNNDGSGPLRTYSCPVLLPTGEVFFSGGASVHGDDDAMQSNPVLQGEIYNPGINWQTGRIDHANESWQTVEAATVQRHYHSTALLMPNGAVWTAGSNGPSDAPVGNNTREKQIEVYDPPYMSQSGRPDITDCSKSAGYAFSFDIETPQANSIRTVALMRCGSVTHGFNPDQRYITLHFSVTSQNTLTAIVPFLPDTIPPGRYMVWIIDDQGRPCEWAWFIRISKQKLLISSDISTYSIHEVNAVGLPAQFNEALYITCDGFLPGEVTTPTVYFTKQDHDTPVPGITATLGAPLYESDSQNLDVAQRITYPVHITFNNTDAFDDIVASEDFGYIIFHARMENFNYNTTLTLSKNPNPRMRDGDPPWLSVDLRVFQTKEDEAFTAGVTHGSGGNAPHNYIQEVLSEYNKLAGQGNHPFLSLPTDLDSNRLALYSEDANGKKAYNYAIAKVRYRAPENINALDVRVFFRLWTTGWTALEYNADPTKGSYRRNGDGANATPLLGLEGGEINNIPCFAEERSGDMEDQSDGTNRITMLGKDAQVVHAYFGCWLDLNDGTPRFPIEPPDNFNGPFTGDLKTIQELMRGLHQCLVAEIHYTPDPIMHGATPGSSDNLAQRNIVLDESDNPGGFAAHLVHHTFEIKPSPYPLRPPEIGNTGSSSIAGFKRLHPDELVIDWGNLPRESQVTFYIPQLNADDVVNYAGQRQNPGNLRKAASDALTMKVADVGYIPIPGPLNKNIAGLMSVQLPPGVHKGEKYSVVVRQVDGRKLKVVGTFQFDILVRTGAEILPRLIRNLSVLKHIALAIPGTNRWHPVFQRYIVELNSRIRSLGADPEAVHPDPTGNGNPQVGPGEGRPPLPSSDEGGYKGKVCEVFYDCFGEFEGFVLKTCRDEIYFRCQEKSMEKVIRKACRDRLNIRVIPHPEDQQRPIKVILCC